jgi:hypothetical protein
MGSSEVRTIGVALFIAACACPSTCQQAPRAGTLPLQAVQETSSSFAGMPARGAVQRVITDPHLGLRWLLSEDPSRPGGPGLLIPIAAGQIDAPLSAGVLRSPVTANQRLPLPSLPVIRTGDRLIVEENTALVEARLEAVALSPAQTGSAFNVRLVAGGKIVRAVALGPGRAAFATARRARP